MKELDKVSVAQHLNSKVGTAVLFFYTPFCGTCKVAMRMLENALKLLPGCHVGKCNLNVMPEVAQQLKIKSVPYAVFLKNGKIIKEIYAFHSVEYVYSMLKQYAV